MTTSNKPEIKTTTDLQAHLAGFTGTEQYYRHWLPFRYTDGVKALADLAGAHWLLDLIGSYQPKISNIPFQIWRVQSHGGRGLVTMREDSDLPVKIKQTLRFTDFPEGDYELYYIDGVLLLKSEY